MSLQKYSHQDIIDRIKSLPVIFEIGEYKLYDISRFEEYYPDLMDEFYWKREDWSETFYNSVENRQPDPENSQYFRYLKIGIKEMVENDENPEWKTYFIDTNDTEKIIMEFYDQFLGLYDGIIELLDELNERLYTQGTDELEEIFLNLYDYHYGLNLDSLIQLQEVVNATELKKYSKRNTIKKSEFIRNLVCSDPNERVEYDFPDFLLPEIRPRRHSSKEINYYDYLYETFLKQIDKNDGADYNFKIVANLFPLMYHGLIKEELIADFPDIFKPSTSELLTGLSTVNCQNLSEFIKEKYGDPEVKYLLAFLLAEFKWRIEIHEDPSKLIMELLSHLVDSELYDCIETDLLNPIMSMIGYHSV